MNNPKNNYLVSVIIPTYNGGGVLKNAINSIINQTIGFENIELIIVDDASTDNITKEIILDYQSQYPDNIKSIFMEKNSGHAGLPRNIGLKKATSNYILFSDDDDIYLEEGFKILYDAIKKYDSDLVIGNAYVMVDGENVNNSKKNNIINIDPLFDQKNFDMLTKNVGVAPWAKIYKKEIFLNNNIKFIETTSFDDIPFYLELLKYLNKVSVLHDSFTYVYNIYKTSMVHTYDLKKINEYIESLKYIAGLFKDINININYVLSFGISQLLLIFSNLDNDSKKDAVLKIYKLEEDLEKLINFNFNFERKEVTILNTLIMQKKFKSAIFLSNIYRTLYNNDFIQKFYKKFR